MRNGSSAYFKIAMGKCLDSDAKAVPDTDRSEALVHE